MHAMLYMGGSEGMVELTCYGPFLEYRGDETMKVKNRNKDSKSLTPVDPLHGSMHGIINRRSAAERWAIYKARLLL